MPGIAAVLAVGRASDGDGGRSPEDSCPPKQNWFTGDVELFTDWHTWQRAEPELRRLLPASTCDAVGDAVTFALRYHGDQKRPTGAPYAEHLLEALEVLVRGAGVSDPDVLCAAVLHDVVEDTPCTIDDVRAAFGDRVADMVGWVTKPDAGRRRRQEGGQGGLPEAPGGRAGRRDPRQAGRPGVQRADAAQPPRRRSSGSTTRRPSATSCRWPRHAAGGPSGTRAGRRPIEISPSARPRPPAARPAPRAARWPARPGR